MTNMVEQLFQLVEKLSGNLLAWPFLMFVFLIWLVHHYRDQIGSMLDRRASVGAGELAKAVRRGLEPIKNQVNEIAPTVSDLRSRVDQLESLHAEQKLPAALESFENKVLKLDGAVADVRTELQRLSDNDPTQQLKQDREALFSETAALRQSVELHQEQLGTLRETTTRLNDLLKTIPAELEDKFQSVVKGLRQETATLKQAMDELHSQMEAATSKEITDRLQAELKPLAQGLDELRQSVGALQTVLASSPTELEQRFVEHIRPIDQDVAALKQSLDQLQGQVMGAASKEMTDRLQNEIDPLTQGLERLKESVGTLEAAVQSVPKELEARFAEYLQPINREVASIKESMVQLSTPAAVTVSTGSTAGTKGTAAPRSTRKTRSRTKTADPA